MNGLIGATALYMDPYIQRIRPGILNEVSMISQKTYHYYIKNVQCNSSTCRSIRYTNSIKREQSTYIDKCIVYKRTVYRYQNYMQALVVPDAFRETTLAIQG